MHFPRGLLDIILLAMMWGPSFLFIKIAIRDIQPLTLVAIRITLGALILFLVIQYKKLKIPFNLKYWLHCFILGIFANGLPFICFNYSLVHIPSSLSALINGTTPVLTVILANLFLQDERLTVERAIGVALGIMGFGIIFLPALLGDNNGQSINKLGILFSLIGSSCYAIAAVYARRFFRNAPPYVAPFTQLLSSLLYLIPLAFIFEQPKDLITASLTTWCAIFALACLGTAFAYLLYYRIIKKQGATALSMVTYLIPIIGTFFGVVFLKEQIGIHFCLAAVFIFLGVLIVNGVIKLPAFHRDKAKIANDNLVG